MVTQGKARVAVNGYGVIGRRVVDAIGQQDDMALVGVSDVATDWRIRDLGEKGLMLFAAASEFVEPMKEAGLDVAGTLDELLGQIDLVVDCTPKKFGATNAPRYREAGVKFIVQGGEKHELTGHSFVAEANYETAVGRDSTRVVSCNTTSIVRTLTALKQAGLLRKARGTVMRRAADPWETHLNGIMNTLVPEPLIPSHQAPDAQTVDPDLDVVTIAVKVPETLGHLHAWNVQLARPADRQEVLDALRSSSRIATVCMDEGMTAVNTVKELMLDLRRPFANLYEVALWEDLLTVQGDEAFYAYMVDNQAIVIPETIDAIRALTSLEAHGPASIEKTNASLGIRSQLVPEPVAAH